MSGPLLSDRPKTKYGFPKMCLNCTGVGDEAAVPPTFWCSVWRRQVDEEYFCQKHKTLSRT
jgi:hypothetical protein